MPMIVALYALAKTLGMKWVARAGAALLVAAASATLAADQRALLEKIDSDVFGLPAPASAGKPLVSHPRRRRDCARLPVGRRRR
jgi:hypothetical protein